MRRVGGMVQDRKYIVLFNDDDRLLEDVEMWTGQWDFEYCGKCLALQTLGVVLENVGSQFMRLSG